MFHAGDRLVARRSTAPPRGCCPRARAPWGAPRPVVVDAAAYARGTVPGVAAAARPRVDGAAGAKARRERGHARTRARWRARGGGVGGDGGYALVDAEQLGAAPVVTPHVCAPSGGAEDVGGRRAKGGAPARGRSLPRRGGDGAAGGGARRASRLCSWVRRGSCCWTSRTRRTRGTSERRIVT